MSKLHLALNPHRPNPDGGIINDGSICQGIKIFAYDEEIVSRDFIIKHNKQDRARRFCKNCMRSAGIDYFEIPKGMTHQEFANSIVDEWLEDEPVHLEEVQPDLLIDLPY